MKGGWLLGRDEVPAGDIDRSLLGRFVDVDRVRRLVQLRQRDPGDGRLRLPVVHALEPVRRFGIELVARALVDVRRLVGPFGSACDAQPHDESIHAVVQRGRCFLLCGIVFCATKCTWVGISFARGGTLRGRPDDERRTGGGKPGRT